MASASEFQRRLREAQRKAQREVQRQVDQINHANKKTVDDYNRKAEQHNRRVISDYNRHVDAVNKHNKQTFNNLAGQLVAASRPQTVTYTVQERQLVDRVQEATLHQDDREYDVFLSYARLDGAEVAQALRDALVRIGVSVWHDEIAIRPGRAWHSRWTAGFKGHGPASRC